MSSSVNECYQPILVKLSGEALGGGGIGIDQEALEFLGQELLAAQKLRPQIAIVIGGGNFYRGRQAQSQTIERIQADQVGMLATVMNGVILQQWIQSKGLKAKVLSAFPVGSIADEYSPEIAKEYLRSGYIIFLTGGTGNPFFTTDTTASLRALEIGANIVIKATKVDGIYDMDPMTSPEAIRFREVDFDTAIHQRLQVMDATAFALCRDNNLSIRVINITKAGNLRRALDGEDIGTLVTNRGEIHE